MNENEPDRYEQRDVFLGVVLALLIAFGLWLMAAVACFASLDMLARLGL